MSPFTNVAKSNEDELISSCDFDTVNFDSNSSKTFTDFAFSDLTWPAVWALTASTPGIVVAVEDSKGGKFGAARAKSSKWVSQAMQKTPDNAMLWRIVEEGS